MGREQIALLVVNSVFAIPGVIIGIVLCCGKGADLIAGYNTASPEERARYDEKALCRGVGVLLLVMVGCIELILAGAALGRPALSWGGGVLLALSVVVGLVYLNRSPRFKQK